MTDDQIAEIRDAFNMYDKERKGEIPTSILGTVMKNLGHNLKPDQLAECIEAVDGDGKFFKVLFFFHMNLTNWFASLGSGTVDFVCSDKIEEKSSNDFVLGWISCFNGKED